MIPDWLTQDCSSVPMPASLDRGRSGFVEKTINNAARFLRDTMVSETIACRNGLLQAIDPRIKLITLLVVIISVSILRSPIVIWGIYGLTLLLAVASSISLLFFLKRVWLFIPLFSAFIVIPALFNVVTPGEPLLTVFHLAQGYDFGPYHIPGTITITGQGVLTAVTFIGRVSTSVSLAVLLTLTTQWSNLLQALRVLKVPRIFILILGMTYRYIILLVHTVYDIHVARKSRTLHYGSTVSEQRWVASRMSYLLKKTYLISLDVHKAMLSRGYSGDIRTLTIFRTRGYDYAWCLFVIFVCAFSLVIDRTMVPR
ncbi:MAG TPA: cobalt ECF transporter T component CbiQ [Desulfomonilia bacterium]|nr:cobalt ECF transporter T component CbiQ [Desulfomonilia bacterium]